MNNDALLEQVLEQPSALRQLVAPLSDAEAANIVDRLKSEADRHWWINANRSLELAELIVQIGHLREDIRHTALGMMARGDALKLLGRTADAWEALGQAGHLFRSVSDEVGWARTRIGRVLICVDLNRVGEGLEDAKQARDILTRREVRDKLVVLNLNTAIAHDLLGDHRQALTLYNAALETARSLGTAGQRYLGMLYNCIGLAYEALGDLGQALAHHERAHTIFLERNEISAAAITEQNIAYIAMAQGSYRRALDLLHRAHDLKVDQQLPLDAAHAKRAMVECYLLLNRYAEARDLARQVSEEYHEFGATYKQALTLLHLATAEAELFSYAPAQAALDTAEAIFTSLGAQAFVATTRLRRGRIALRQGDAHLAEREAMAAIACFEAGGQRVSYAMAKLLHGQALLALGDVQAAARAGAAAVRIAQSCHLLALRYTAHLLLGRVAEAQADLVRAQRRYWAAAATVERAQRGLTITLRPGFLEDKSEALRALIALHLRSGKAGIAFETLERAKSQVLLSYLTNRQQLRWAGHDPRSRALIDELERLRAEHQWLYRLAHELPVDEDQRPTAYAPEQALAQIAIRERHMRAISEQLYLHNGEDGPSRPAAVPSLRDIQRRLDDDTLLIEFYNDSAHMWAFALDSRTIEVYRLPATVDDCDRLLAQLQANLAFALRAGPCAPTAQSLVRVGQRVLQQFYTALLGPLAPRLRGRRRLVVVPYGALHYLPFHLLHDGATYLIEQHEVVVLPSAGLATRRGPTRPGGALVLAHSWNGQLPQTHVEAQVVHQLFGGAAYYDEQAQRAVLRQQPGSILHIAAHGQHRLDQPDLSYIQLADGQLYTDDLFQHDLSYELVTLSACETGRANVAAGDELIGLGRGFLYAGAGALMASLWRVADAATVILMEHVYRALRGGASKAAALRDAQRAILASEPQLHPAFWGAFQLVGDAGPLSTYMPTRLRKERYKHATHAEITA